MNEFYVSFWNVNNLFDTLPTSIGSTIEFTPDRGWNNIVKNKKIENLAHVINSLHENQGPDIIGLCEIESEKLALNLIDKLRAEKEYSIAQYLNSPDIRGIDTCLLYSKKLFRLNTVKGYSTKLRYPTRDILVVNLTVLSNNAELNIIVNHWPSRAGGRFETEPLRIAVAENCAHAVEDILKISLSELQNLPWDLRYDEKSLSLLNERWNKNILLMGDFNDNPYDRSILSYLHATPDKRKLMNWGEIFEHPIQKRWPSNKQTDKHNYLFYQGYLFNCMWSLIPDGTIFYDGGYDLFDQFIVSRGLLNGEQDLKIDLNKIHINKKIQLDRNLSYEFFDTRNRNKIHPSYGQSPMRFEYQRIKPNGDLEELSPGRTILTGYSDHFPIESTINIL
jgi:endonuclease/exonuclease/phosphatase family metal-dependent hydrolase